MSDPFLDAARSIPGPEDQERERELGQAQDFAADRPADRSADLLKRARALGITLELAEAGQEKTEDWRELTRGLPATQEFLADPARAAAAGDDVGALAKIEKAIRGIPEIAWETKEGLTSGRITTRLAEIGYRQSQGVATPEELAEADRLEAQQAAIPRPDRGLVVRAFRAAAESLPLMWATFTRSGKEATTGALSGAVAGAAAGSPFGGVGAGPGAASGFVAGAGIGFKVGMTVEMAKAEQGLAYREYVQIPGVTHEAAKLASTFVGIANGLLEVAPLEVVLQIPGLKALVGRVGVRDAFRAALRSTTGRAVVARAAARLGAGMTLEGLTEAAQELSTILGGQYAAGEGLDLSRVDWARVGEAGVEGALAASVMGGPGLAAGTTAEALEVRRAQERADFFKALGEATAGSKTFERLPEDAQAFVERAQERHGGPVEAVSVPAEKLQTLFQKNEITLEQVGARMPAVARQLEETAGNPGVEVTIPIGEFAANVARLPGYETLVEDLRVGDELTLREAREAEGEAKKLAEADAKRERTAQETVTPAQRVLQDVAGKLEGIGMDPESARANAALWAAFSSTMGKRSGKDAWSFYEGLGLDIRSTEVQRPGEAPVTVPRTVPEGGVLRERPKWLAPEAYSENPPAWEWTLAAVEDAYGKTWSDPIPEMVHQMVFRYMERALEDFPVNTYGLQQGFAVARLFANRRGGKTAEQWRERFAEWFSKSPEEQAKEDPVPERAWGKLIELQRADTKMVSLASGRVYPKKVDRYQAWYEKTAAEITAALGARDPELAQLNQASPSGVEVGRRQGAFTFEHPESPLRLYVYDEGDALSAAVLGFNDRVRPATPGEELNLAQEYGGKGYSTALYLRALEEAQRQGKAFTSDDVNRITERTERMYARLQELGVPFKLEGERFRIEADELAKVDLDKAWRTLLAETEIKTLRAGMLMQKGAATPRGFMQFDAARSFFRITLTGRANLSTFLHESGHAFLEILRRSAGDPTAPADVKADLAALEKWLAVPIGGVWTEAQLERFARGFEAYLREGKAPAPGLVEAFRAFKAWLVWIYRTLRGLDVELTDEVRGVMDRMLATEAEIAQAQRDAALLPAFESADAAGMTEAQFQAYRERFERGAQVSRERLERQTLAALARTMGEERRRALEDATAAARLNPVFNLREWFRTGERLDGVAMPEELKGMKLDSGALEGLTDSRGKRRIRFFVVAEGGMDPDDLAPFFGFRDGATLVHELATAPRRESWIKAEVQKRLEERYPESTVGSIRPRAVKEIRGQEDFVRALRDELDAVGRKVGEPPARSALDVLRLGARERVRTMTGADMRPDRYRRAAASAGREFLEQLAAKKWIEAHDAKRRQMWNELLAREVAKARDRVEQIREHLASFEDVGKRARIGKVGGHYLAAIDEILDGLGFRRESLRAVRKRQRLAEYVAQIEAEGGVVTPELRELSDLKSYREMTLDELEAVNAAVSNLEALARLKGKLLVGKERRDLARLAHELAEHVRANVGRTRGPTPGEKPPGERLRSWARRGDASMKKVEFLMRELDGGKTAGLFHSVAFQPIADAQAARYDLQEEVFAALVAPFRALDADGRRRYRQKIGFLPSQKFGGKMIRLTRRDLLSVVLNMGNEGNRARLLQGYGWTEEQVRARLAQLLDQGDVAIIEHIWKTVDSLWPAIRDLYERHAGLPPKRVEATPFTLVLADGTEAKLSGGYYPIAKNPELSDMGRNLAELEEATSLWTANFFAPVVEHGFTQSRGKDMSPLELSLDVAPRHLDKVIHYVTHYEAVRNVDRLLQVPELRQAITEGVGREYLLELRPWLEAIAADGVLPDPIGWWSRLLRHFRFGSTVVLLFGKIPTGLKQALGLFTSANEIRRRHMVSGLREFMRKGWSEYVKESSEGRHLDKQLDRDARELFVSLQGRMNELGRARAQVIEWGALPIMLVQKAVNAATWYAAREQALAEGHADPVAYADSLVRMTQTGGGVKDLAAIQRGGEAFKMLTVMFSYRSVLYNLLTERTGKGGWAKARQVFGRFWFLILLPVVAEQLLMAGVKDDEDEEDVAKRLSVELALLPASTVPVLGDVARAGLAGYDTRPAPWMWSFGRAADSLADVAQGEGDVRDARAISDAAGIVLHLPTTSLWNTGEWAVRALEGDLEEPFRDLLLRSPSQWE